MNYDIGEPESRSSRWGVLTLPVLLVIGWVLYELTAQPALGVAAVCIKFGWDDFRTAWWLHRRDNRRNRARACFWLYIASGLWKVAITASIMIFAYLLLRVAGALAARRAWPHVLGSLLTAFGGIGMATVAACWSVARGMVGGDKLWLHHGVHVARRRDIWPPPHWPANSGNLAGILLGTTLFAFGVPVILTLVLLGVTKTLGPLNQPGAALLVLFGFPGLCIAWALALFRVVRGVLGPRVFAATPAECWQPVAVVKKEAALTFVGDEIAATWGKSEVSLLEERAQRLD